MHAHRQAGLHELWVHQPRALCARTGKQVLAQVAGVLAQVPGVLTPAEVI